MDGDLSFDVLAASLRVGAADTGVFAEALAKKLADALPGRVRVKRRGAPWARDRPLERLEVDVGPHRYLLAVHDRRLTATRARVVGDVTIKGDQLTVDEWVDDLSRQLAQEATRDDATRAALARLLSVR